MMKWIYTALGILVFLFSGQVNGQDKGQNPQLDRYYDKCRKFIKANQLDSARYYAGLALQMAKAENRSKDEARSLLYLAQSSYTIAPREGLYIYLSARNSGLQSGEKAVVFRASLTIGAIYRRESKFDSTRFHYNECIKIANELITENRTPENLKRLGMVYNNYGAYYTDVGEFSKAAWYLVETEKVGRELKDTGMMLRAAINVGAIYSELGSPENKLSTGYTAKMFLQKAKSYYFLARELIRPEDERNRPHVLNNIGVVYQNLGKYDSAIYFLSQALELYKKTGNIPSECSCNYSLGSAIYKTGKLDVAAAHFDQAIAIAEKNDLKTCLMSALSNKGQYLTETNRLDEAEKVLKRAMDIKNSMGNFKENYLLYEKFYILYEKKQDYKKAFEYYKKFVYARDSVASVEHLNILEDLEVRYESEKKDEKISELGLEKQLLLEKTRVRDAQLRLRNFLISGLLLFLAMGAALVWFWIQRNRMRQQQKASDLEHRLLRARMNPHFLFNGLNTIQKHYEEGDTESAGKFMADFSKFLRLILLKTGETKHSLADEIEFTQLYASLEQRKYPDRIFFETRIAPEVETDTWTIPSLLLQPLVENAIWHGILPTNRPGHIVLDVREDDKQHLLITLTDDGVGFKNSLIQKKAGHVSKALEMVHLRLGKSGKVAIDTLNPQTDGSTGTRITLLLTDEI
ncbi:MAG: tetratricopeptide repeat protein [Bacteroidetes bacterium]|nr:tetratricopeptide repeat protein [Bacteroidota bacterium]